MLINIEIEDNLYKYYLIELGEINGAQTVTILNNQSTLYAVTRKDIFELLEPSKASAFIFNNRYLLDTFQGIMLDSGAAGILTAG